MQVVGHPFRLSRNLFTFRAAARARAGLCAASVLFVLTTAGCAQPTEDAIETSSNAFTGSAVVHRDRVHARFYIHSNLYGKRTMGFDVAQAAVTERFPHHAASSARAFALVPHEKVDGTMAWVRWELFHLDTVTRDGELIERYRASAGAELKVPMRPSTRAAGVAFGIDTVGGTLWMQEMGANTPIEEGGEGQNLDGSL